MWDKVRKCFKSEFGSSRGASSTRHTDDKKMAKMMKASHNGCSTTLSENVLSFLPPVGGVPPDCAATAKTWSVRRSVFSAAANRPRP